MRILVLIQTLVLVIGHLIQDKCIDIQNANSLRMEVRRRAMMLQLLGMNLPFNDIRGGDQASARLRLRQSVASVREADDPLESLAGNAEGSHESLADGALDPAVSNDTWRAGPRGPLGS